MTAAGCSGPFSASHSANKAAWIWAAPLRHPRETRFLRFELGFDVAAACSLRFHVTADQRFQLSLDGESLAYGPDRSGVGHWAVSTYEVSLDAGQHAFSVLAWCIEDLALAQPALERPPVPPMAQASWRGGFLLHAEGEWAAQLDTGVAPWTVQDLTGAVGLERKGGLAHHDIGPSFMIAMYAWERPCAEAAPVVVQPPLDEGVHGVIRPGWTLLQGSDLPEQLRSDFTGGSIRALRSSWDDGPFQSSELSSPGVQEWNALLAGNELELAAGTATTLIWDFEQYVCGYPRLEWSGGQGARLEVEWAESLYHSSGGAPVTANAHKGQRDAIAGKVWLGFGDVFVASGSPDAVSPGIWWRSGRFIRLRVRVGEEPLRLRRLAVLTTCYPSRRSCTWASSDPGWDSLHPLLHDGLEACAHETWVDCPYYEQMMYVGDTALHALSNYTCYRDSRLTRRAIELFDRSREHSRWGFPAERYPSGWRQESPTFALIWVWMLRDFALWQDDPDFLRLRLPGMRQLLESFLGLRGLLMQAQRERDDGCWSACPAGRLSTG